MSPEEVSTSLGDHILWLALFYAITRAVIWIAVWGWAIFGPIDEMTDEEWDRLFEKLEAALRAKSVDEIDAEHY